MSPIWPQLPSPMIRNNTEWFRASRSRKQAGCPAPAREDLSNSVRGFDLMPIHVAAISWQTNAILPAPRRVPAHPPVDGGPLRR
jgi:hypothetical protein